MSSILKVQNIQYTDGDSALTIADGGGVTAASTLGVTGDLTLSRAETNGTVRLNLSNTGANGSSEYSEIKLNSTAGGAQTSIIQHRNNYGLNIGTTTDHPIYFLQNNATAMSLDANGYVTKPLQPRMSNYKYTSQTIPHNTLTPIQYNGTNWTNAIQGITSSNTHSRYTVPVAGWYFLHATLYWGNAVVTGSMISVHVNGSYKAYTYNQSMPVYTQLQVTHGLYLQASDYFEFMAYHYNGSNLGTVADSNGEGSMFATAYLLG